MPIVLIVEDDPGTRAVHCLALVRSDVTVLTASTVAEVDVLLGEVSPDMVFLDLCLQDGTGIDVLQRLDRRGMRPVVVVISAYLEQFRDEESSLTSLLRINKPADPAELRRLVDEHVSSSSLRQPFSVAEYVQVACLGGHSLILRCSNDRCVGAVVVVEGSVWGARWGNLKGFEAFASLVSQKDLEVRFAPLTEVPGSREMAGNWQELLIEAARLEDESRLSVPQLLSREELDFSDLFESVQPTSGMHPLGTSQHPGAKTPSLAAPDGVPDAEINEQAARLIEQGVQAVLARHYSDAVRYFEQALVLSPSSASIRHRLERLYELGYGAA